RPEDGRRKNPGAVEEVIGHLVSDPQLRSRRQVDEGSGGDDQRQKQQLLFPHPLKNRRQWEAENACKQDERQKPELHRGSGDKPAPAHVEQRLMSDKSLGFANEKIDKAPGGERNVQAAEALPDVRAITGSWRRSQRMEQEEDCRQHEKRRAESPQDVKSAGGGLGGVNPYQTQCRA